MVDFISDLRSKVMFKDMKKSTHEEEGVKRLARSWKIVIPMVVGKYKKNIEMLRLDFRLERCLTPAGTVSLDALR